MKERPKLSSLSSRQELTKDQMRKIQGGFGSEDCGWFLGSPCDTLPCPPSQHGYWECYGNIGSDEFGGACAYTYRSCTLAPSYGCSCIWIDE